MSRVKTIFKEMSMAARHTGNQIQEFKEHNYKRRINKLDRQIQKVDKEIQIASKQNTLRKLQEPFKDKLQRLTEV